MTTRRSPSRWGHLNSTGCSTFAKDRDRAVRWAAMWAVLDDWCRERWATEVHLVPDCASSRAGSAHYWSGCSDWRCLNLNSRSPSCPGSTSRSSSRSGRCSRRSSADDSLACRSPLASCWSGPYYPVCLVWSGKLRCSLCLPIWLPCDRCV